MWKAAIVHVRLPTVANRVLLILDEDLTFFAQRLTPEQFLVLGNLLQIEKRHLSGTVLSMQENIGDFSMLWLNPSSINKDKTIDKLWASYCHFCRQPSAHRITQQ